jgi:Leucine-rich repeat (LRR) protein
MQNLFALTLGPSSLTGDIGNFYNNCSLQVLEIGCTQINSVDLSNCNNLEQLDVGNSPITQISKDPSTVCGFNNLIILYLQNTKLDSNSINLYCLNKLSNLQVLDISYNSFSGAAPTLNQAIYQVFMSNNNFNSIPNMANCKNITYIDFSYNKITTVSGLLPPMVNTILLNNNNIADNIDNFVWSASVAIFVNISNNNFHGYVKAQYPSKLQTLDARYNVKITESPVISTNCKIEWDYTMLYLIKDSDNNSWLCPTGIVTHNNLLYCWDPTRYRIYVDPVFSNYQACNELTK